MEEVDKNQIILILVITNLIFFVATVSLGRQVHRQKISLAKEINLRFDLEAKEAEFNKTIGRAEEKIKTLERGLEEEKAVRASLEKTLEETKEELEKTTKLKEALEEDLKEALVKNKSLRK
ncbi:MAG: hypothetical protein NC829_03430 [Candidatus Omnitrophica bacterium]|nr:hypothetical protein [Candidatus Omnitrophota bacterium]